MVLKTIFSKPVDRPIEGVIKADDESSLRLEIEEYVLTNEIEKSFETFLEAYNNYEGANGVWVSGFFGSGKSHLLKILALLLENRRVDGTSALDLFLPKCGDNEMLRGDLKRVVAIPSKSILFNIDQKADVISKTQNDALLSVFVKVFDEMCGYYGRQGHIAQFERDLDSRGLYEKFKSAYESTARKTWSEGREQALLEETNIAEAYSLTTGCDRAQAVGILGRYRSQHHVSIEDFARQVSEYIERQSPGFRLNFFVDEVGQYIAGNTRLMTNLQTIAESLATKCGGRAWIIVTAQEEMGTVIGEMNKQIRNDFSKIQDRFSIRMHLTSADVDEVIRKRLLTKTEEGFRVLSELYAAQSNNFGTLFDFTDGSHAYRNFRDRDHFIDSYPFIPYQFALFQSAIQNLSLHDAFEGRHSSVGERSMLSVFQQVAIRIGDHKTGQLATFDLMFEGIRTVLKAGIQKAVIQAENHLNDHFAIRLLKTLFLVKYVREFKSTVRNLRVLMLEDFDQDLSALGKRIEEALGLLEQQTYVQRNGELYEYLTDEEKDIEKEIKNTEVAPADIADELVKIVFDHVIRDRTIRYGENRQDYPFSRKLDDRLFGRESELAINIISPFHENAQNEDAIRVASVYRMDELFVLMPADERLMRDVTLYKQTDKYVRQNFSTSQQDAVKRILTDKSLRNRERYADLQERVVNLMGSARLLVAGSEIEIASGDPKARVDRGFQELVTRAYPNLRMLRGVPYTENDIAKCLERSERGLFGAEGDPLSEPEQELFAFIRSNQQGGVRTTLKSLLEKFERAPYGWQYAAVLCILAKLCARGRVEVRADGNVLEDNDLERALRNTREHGNMVLEPQVEFTASQIRALRNVFEDFFDAPPHAGEARELGKETCGAFRDLIQQLTPLAALGANYPFLNGLTPVIEKLTELAAKSNDWHLTELARRKDDLLAMKEGVIDPIRRFMNGPQKNIYDNAQTFVLSQEPNFAYIEGDEAAQVNAGLRDPDCFKGDRMQQMKKRVEALQEKIAARISAEIAGARGTVAALKNRLEGMAEFGALNAGQREQILRPFDEFSASIGSGKLIAVIRDSLRRFEESDYRRQLSQMTALSQPAQIPGPGEIPAPTPAPEPRIEYVPGRAVKVSFGKAWLADETDVDWYLEAMREALLEEIRKGKRIQV